MNIATKTTKIMIMTMNTMVITQQETAQSPSFCDDNDNIDRDSDYDDKDYGYDDE